MLFQAACGCNARFAAALSRSRTKAQRSTSHRTSLARKRSDCPLSRRSLGRMCSPVWKLPGIGNHARAHGSICRERHPQPAQTGENEDLPRAKTHAGSEACEFFTDDSLSNVRLERFQAKCAALRLKTRQNQGFE